MMLNKLYLYKLFQLNNNKELKADIQTILTIRHFMSSPMLVFDTDAFLHDHVG